MTQSKGEQILRRIAKAQNVKFEYIEKVLELYGSDLSEEEIEEATKKYPPEVVSIASKAFLGTLL